MQINALCKGHPMHGRSVSTKSVACRGRLRKIFRIMRFTAFFLLVCSLQLSASVSSQSLTLNGRMSMNKVFEEVRKQTGYLVFYDLDVINAARPVSLNVKDMPLVPFLQEVLSERDLTFTIRDKNIIIRALDKPADAPVPATETAPPSVIAGVVLLADGTPMPGANILIKGGKSRAITDENGRFQIQAKPGDILVVTFVGFIPQEIRATETMRIILQQSVSPLDEKIVQAYGLTSQRLSTSNIFKVSGKDVNKSPVTNVLAALAGRVPGVDIVQSTGNPGSAFNVIIRGRTQLDKFNSASNEPLFILDGVPLAAGNANINRLQSAISASSTSGLSPINSINMADIESIEVLKDADATAIYGSRGANGVIMITTRRAKTGDTRYSFNVYNGVSKAKLPKLLNTKDYVAMRNEAFANDNRAKTISNAYDLLVFDTTFDANLPKEFIGGSASNFSAQGSVSGGSELARYMISGSYDRTTNVLPVTTPNTRIGGQFTLDTRTRNNRFSATYSGSYMSSKNTATGVDLAQYITLPPNFPLYDSTGELMWNYKGVQKDNPLGNMYVKYNALTENLMANAKFNYNITRGLAARVSVGYNSLTVNETSLTPKKAQNPLKADLSGMAQFGNNRFKSWIIEPQVDYNRSWDQHHLSLLGGGTFQQQINKGYSFTVRGYTSDEFLGTFSGLPANAMLPQSSTDIQYKYQAFFGRVNYNYADKYLLNLSGRRDGSSRFGPNYRFSNFGAVGAAWLFSEEEFARAFKALSYGKLRASYGVTGNDKIADYKYLDAYTSNAFYPTYNNETAFSPSDLFRPDLHWEKNVKMEIALETGFLDDKLLFNVAWYRNRTSDPLVNFNLPSVTGFSAIAANMTGVVIDNTGWEFSLVSNNIRKKDFEWTTNVNLTVPRTRLARFDNLDQSPYYGTYIVGKPLNILYIAQYTGVDPKTGLYTIADLNNSGKFESNGKDGDFAPILNTDPKYYGGITNSFRYKQVGFSIFLQYSRRYGPNWFAYMRSGFSTVPVGGDINVPYEALNTWKQPGDQAKYQQLHTVNPAGNSLQGFATAMYSDLTYSDASFIRVKNVELSWNLPQSFLKTIHFSNLRLYAQAQNLFTFTPMKVVDPETAYINRLPPLRTIVVGIQAGF